MLKQCSGNLMINFKLKAGAIVQGGSGWYMVVQECSSLSGFGVAPTIWCFEMNILVGFQKLFSDLICK